MEKIPTLFVRDPKKMQFVTDEPNAEAAWVLAGEGVPTQKRDGTNVRVTVAAGKIVQVEKRRNPTREEKAAGAEPGYVDANRADPADKWIFTAVDATDTADWPDGSWPCEALGAKIQGGAEGDEARLYPFSRGADPIPRTEGEQAGPRTFAEIRDYLAMHEMEGIVWHHPDGRMAKIKRRDFGLPWPVNRGR